MLYNIHDAHYNNMIHLRSIICGYKVYLAAAAAVAANELQVHRGRTRARLTVTRDT